MYVYHGYPAMSKSPKQLPHFTEKNRNKCGHYQECPLSNLLCYYLSQCSLYLNQVPGDCYLYTRQTFIHIPLLYSKMSLKIRKE